MHKLIIRLKSGYEIPITCEDFTFEENQLSGELVNYEIKGIKDNVPLYFRIKDVDCVVENLYGTADRPQGEWEMQEDADRLYGICSVCGQDADFSHYYKAYNYCPNCGARMIDEDINVPNKKGAEDD